MPNCPNCGRDVQSGMKFCPNCGQDQGVLVPQDQRIPTDDMPVPPPPSDSPQGGLLSEKSSTVVMEGLRAVVWGFALWWGFWIVVLFVGFFYIIGDELAGYVPGLIAGGIFAFFALRILWSILKRFLGAVGNAFKALLTNDTVAPLNATRKGSLSEGTGPWKGRKGVGTALRAVAAAALVLVVSVVEFFSFLLT